jgi:hypothetical protein
MGRTYAGVLGLLAFLVVIARGLIHHGSVSSTLTLALGAMFTFAGIGLVLGQMAAQTVADALRSQLVAETERLRTATKDTAER